MIWSGYIGVYWGVVLLGRLRIPGCSFSPTSQSLLMLSEAHSAKALRDHWTITSLYIILFIRSIPYLPSGYNPLQSSRYFLVPRVLRGGYPSYSNSERLQFFGTSVPIRVDSFIIFTPFLTLGVLYSLVFPLNWSWLVQCQQGLHSVRRNLFILVTLQIP